VIPINLDLALCTRRGYLGRVQVHDFPARAGPTKYDRSSIKKTGSVVQMESRDRTITESLKLHVLWLNMHVRCGGFLTPNLFKNDFESLLKFNASACALGECSRIENGRVVVESLAESFPVEIIERLNKLRQRISKLRFRRFRSLSLRENSCVHQQRD
jgi:hypothetical protein